MPTLSIEIQMLAAALGQTRIPVLVSMDLLFIHRTLHSLVESTRRNHRHKNFRQPCTGRLIFTVKGL